MSRVLSLVGLAGCAGPGLPTSFELTGEASRRFADGTSGECSLDLVFEVQEESVEGGARVQAGTHGGGISRFVLASDGSGLGFHADVFGDFVATTDGPAFEIRVPINETAEGRFWNALASFEGERDADGGGHGRWTCAPLDIDQDGYVDEVVTVRGSWVLTPVAGP